MSQNRMKIIRPFLDRFCSAGRPTSQQWWPPWPSHGTPLFSTILNHALLSAHNRFHSPWLERKAYSIWYRKHLGFISFWIKKITLTWHCKWGLRLEIIIPIIKIYENYNYIIPAKWLLSGSTMVTVLKVVSWLNNTLIMCVGCVSMGKK